MSHYDTLGVPPSAPRAALRAAWQRRRAALAEAVATARTPAHRARAEREARALQAAWDVLGHPARRRAYDRHLGLTPPRAPAPPAAPPIPPLVWLALAALAGALLGPTPLLATAWLGALLAATTLWLARGRT